MKHLAITLCLAGVALGLSACSGTEQKTVYDSGASYASPRTAGETIIENKSYAVEKKFKKHMSK